MFFDNSFDSFRRNFTIKVAGAVAVGNAHERLAVAHPDTARFLQSEIGAVLQLFLERFVNFFAAGGNSTGGQADHHGLRSFLGSSLDCHEFLQPDLLSSKLSHQAARALGGKTSKGFVVDHYDRSQ